MQVDSRARVRSPQNSDLRRAISRPTWFANRARNALRRPAFIGAISIATFVTAVVSMVAAPRTERRVSTLPAVARPDTLTLAAAEALGRVRLAQAESALAAAHAELSATLALGAVADPEPAVAAPDSIAPRVQRLEELLTRVEQAPLPASYRALAGAPELRSDGRVRALLDSLTEVEQERDAVGAVGGVDPVFVSLTSRLNELGRRIQAIATQHRNRLLNEMAVQAPTPRVALVTPATDTVTLIAKQDSIRTALRETAAQLAKRRDSSLAMDRAEQRARERANAVAPPLAMLAAAFVLSAVAGFAVAFIGELRRPRIADANELERFLGVRVLSTVETPMPSVDRGRRRADRSAPTYFDPGAEGYQLAYLGLATEHPTLLMATVAGDDPAITAVVACNLAAIAADEARNSLVLDLEPSCSASAALRTRVEPGILDIVQRELPWPAATVAASVGRDKTVDLVPHGIGSPRPTAEQLIDRLRRDFSRLARYYDAIIVIAGAAEIAAGLPTALPSPEIIYCAQPGITPLRQLRAQLESFRAGGGVVRGVVLWGTERPLLATGSELAGRARNPRAPRAPTPAPAPT